MLHKNRTRVRINVSGSYFETYESTLERFPDTLLGSSVTRSYFFDVQRDEYFFNRNRLAFDAVLFYYQSRGILRRPATVAEYVFDEELKFFRIANPDTTSMDGKNHILLGENIPLPKSHVRRKLWVLFTRPYTSLYAKFLEIISILTLVLSVVISCTETVPEIQHSLHSNNLYTAYQIADHICHAWFTFDFMIRLITVSDRKKFISQFSTIVDLLTTVPFYAQIIVAENVSEVKQLPILRALKFLCIARILKVIRYSRGMRALLYTIQDSLPDLQLYFAIVLLLNVLVASLAFFFENGHEGNLLISIPEAMWWSINTFTTVGYGDYYPITTMGKLLGCACSITGIVFLGLPVYCLVSNFLCLWDLQKDTSNAGLVKRVKVSLRRLKGLWNMESSKFRKPFRDS